MSMKDMLAIKKAVDYLRDEDIRSYLRLILTKIKLQKEQGESPEAFAADFIELYDSLIELQDKRVLWDPAPGCTHVHIVCGDSFAGSMKMALKGLGWSETHKLIILCENYVIGPLHSLDTSEGRKARSDWFRDNITNAFEEYTEFEEEYDELIHQIDQIPEQAKIVIWTSSNAYEQAGMRHALYLLRGKRNTVAVYDACAICEKMYNRPDAYIIYRYSGEITSDKLQEALMRIDEDNKLGDDEIIRLVQEWQAICEQTGVLRIWRDDAVAEVPADYYDPYLLEKLDKLKPPAGNNGFMKSARVIGEALGYCDQYIGDSYFEYRLRELIYAGVLEIKGVPAGMRYYSVRRKRKL
ncbi:DUF1835 domain-containing protein [Paenibacillus jiagnxiensis]|uniref:DUF1835 domain-containing protein n=1 Tax=Paenibacillus jiagnxiensis TaxID=3228926 RepID=UPI0033BDF79E